MGLSVKATESLLREQSGKGTPARSSNGSGGAHSSGGGGDKTAHVKSLEEELRQKLGVPVEIRVQGKNAGQIVLEFAAHDDFERLLEVLRQHFDPKPGDEALRVPVGGATHGDSAKTRPPGLGAFR